MNKITRILSVVLCLCMILPLAMIGVSAEEGKENVVRTLENLALGKMVRASSGTQADAVADGNLATFTFEVKDDAPFGNYEIELTLVDAYGKAVSDLTVSAVYCGKGVHSVGISLFLCPADKLP